MSFEIEEATPYELEASFETYVGPFGWGSTWVSVTGPGDVVAFTIPAEFVASVPAFSPGGLALLVLSLVASSAPFTPRRRG